MQRRNFLQQSFTLGAGMLATSSIACANTNADDAQPFKMNYAPHDGMFMNSAGKDFIDQIKFMYYHGFRSIEDNGMMDRPVEMQKQIGEALAKLGMSMGVFVVAFDHWPVKTSLTSGSAEWRDKFLKACRD